jgi:hypothetical protein
MKPDATPCSTLVTCHSTAGDSVKPQSIFRRDRDDIKTSPCHREDIGDNVCYFTFVIN